MKPLALSTMYAQQDRFADGAVFARFAAEAGYDAIEISHSTREDKLRQILEANILPVTSVHQPAPWVRHSDGRGNSHCNLASIDAAERDLAVAFARTSIDWAAEIGVNRLVVHLGQVSDVAEQFPEELEMRKMFDSGRAAEPRFTELRDVSVEKRRADAEPYVAAARKSLLELVAIAAPRGVTIGLENRYHFHEIPHPHEYDQLLQGLDLDQAGYWHDTGHVEVLHRLGFLDRHTWLTANASRVVGAHLHDVMGIGDHRSPGDGDVDWGYITAGLRQLPGYTLEINQHQRDEQVKAAPEFLASVELR